MAVIGFGNINEAKKQEKEPTSTPAPVTQPQVGFGAAAQPQFSYGTNNPEAMSALAQQMRQNQLASQQSLKDRLAGIEKGEVTPTEGMVRRAEELELGRQQAKKFFETPETAEMEKRLRDLAKGYGSEEMAAKRQEFRGQLAGAQKASQRQMASQAGRSGVGGARAAAMQQAARQESMKAIASAERQALLDSAAMQAQRSQNIVDFLGRKVAGQTGLAATIAGLGSSEYAAQKAREANKGGGGGGLLGFVSNVLGFG